MMTPKAIPSTKNTNGKDEETRTNETVSTNIVNEAQSNFFILPQHKRMNGLFPTLPRWFLILFFYSVLYGSLKWLFNRIIK